MLEMLQLVPAFNPAVKVVLKNILKAGMQMFPLETQKMVVSMQPMNTTSDRFGITNR
jgi:hypothetical protein